MKLSKAAAAVLAGTFIGVAGRLFGCCSSTGTGKGVIQGADH